ncbi:MULTISPECIES: IS66 family insertion sequence element accessory protein TnpB [Bradyrhizobium]|uniref:Transposase n=2 Tax=Bradyrhizobium TaxID=374 RepID=A0AAE5X8D7_9BRAD|nr:hypothetical protein X265_39995 [Bradyrhizobium guangdongense]QAU50570.1 hypothetical protein XH91_34550 [Bradyrhizobium guangzhouense]QOZ49155.1 hypothetical protein XH89_37065 [Bradyrhizobium sp. CCBAU 53340]QOZ56961.1 hypothetical protein XH90_37505 [Bradyrhizobium sp. CCBAU 53338]QOZ80915.1 hypothetical protein XH83_36015 [Bradyrhizobium sp. CCBAU 53351]
MRCERHDDRGWCGFATRPIDFRGGHDGLATEVQEMLRLDPFLGAAFVFRSNRGQRLRTA